MLTRIRTYSRNKSVMWIGLFPELSEVGGIQQVSRHMAAVLFKRAQERKLPCRLLGLNDPRGPGSFKVGPNEYSFTGFGRNKVALLSYLFRLTPRIETLYLGHVNLSPLASLLRGVRPRIKYWVVVHGVEVWTPLPVIRRAGLRFAQRVISVSSYTAIQMAKAQGLKRQAVFVLSPALDPSFLEAPWSTDAISLPSPRSLMLLTVGRLISTEPGKGVDSVIKVLPDVLKAVPDLFYVIAGGGDLQNRLMEMARESGVGDRVLFAGKLKLDQLKGYYARSDVFVMPSRQEGFGIAFLEAMALGKPVVGGDHGGTPEVVRDGVTGLLVNPNDLEALTHCLIKLLQDEALRKKMGEAGRLRLEQNYTFRRFEEELTRILDVQQ